MKKGNYFTISTITLLVLLTSCTQRLMDFTTLSSKNTNMTVPKQATSDRVIGEHYVVTFLGIPFGRPSMKEATDRAIENAGPGYDSLIDGVVSSKYKWFVLFGKIGYEIEGTAIKSDQINSPKTP